MFEPRCRFLPNEVHGQVWTTQATHWTAALEAAELAESEAEVPGTSMHSFASSTKSK